jgi:nucleoid-associated protein YgaU
MRIARVLPLFVVGLSLVGCQGYLTRRPMPGREGEANEKLEATQPAQEKLPEIVALPPVAPNPVYTPPPALATPPVTSVPAASKPGTTVASAPAPFDDDAVPARRPHARRPSHSGGESTVKAARASGGHGQSYTVQRGDTLQKISQKFYGTTKHWKKIFEANKGKMKKPDMIVVGMVITIP